MVNELTAKVTADMDDLTIPQALMEIFAVIQRANKYIDETAPWPWQRTKPTSSVWRVCCTTCARHCACAAFC